MKVEAGQDLREVAFIVCTALEEIGVTAVLTGGSAATVYAPQSYQSSDLDFVIQFHARIKEAGRSLAQLGYQAEGDTYVHASNPLTLDFPPPPLMVGRDIIRSWDTLEQGELLLHILTPTDSCRDRLAHFLFWHDRSGLEQAVAVAKAQSSRIDLPAIRDWSERESSSDAYEEFARRIDVEPERMPG